MSRKKKPEHNLENSKKMIFEVPVEGALGLLALGADGVIAWKEKKKQVKEERQRQQQEQPDKKEETNE